MVNIKPTLRRKTYDFFEMGSFGGFVSAAYDGFMIFLIMANVIAVALETVESLWVAYSYWFNLFELVSIIIFTLEYLLRLWVSVERDEGKYVSGMKSRLRYIFSPLALIDLIAILPFYLVFFATPDLRFLRIFRLLRLLKLVRYSPAMASLGRVLYAERRALFAALIIMLGLMFLAASLMYFIEKDVQPEAFSSIPAAIWWALATLTTVGYGDVVPLTPLGKFVGGTVMIFGLGFYAIPIGVIASGFSDEIHRREFVIPDAVLDNAGLFDDMPKNIRAEILPQLRTIVMPPGTVITHRRDDENGLFIILSGEAHAFFHHRSIPLFSRDVAGEFGVLMDKSQQPAIITRSACKILWMESPELHLLLSMWPEFAGKLRSYHEQRHVELVEEGYLSFSESEEIQALINGRLPI